MQNIEKSIYSINEIKRHLLPLWWAVILTMMGAICAFFFVKYPNISPALNALLLGVMAIGVFGLLTIICFYIFGDKYRPMHKPTHTVLEVVHTYYASKEREALVAALQNNDVAGLQAVKKATAPQLVLVEYSNDDETIRYAQLQEYSCEHYTPITEVYNLSQAQQ